MSSASQTAPPPHSYGRKLRGIALQVLLCAVVVALAYGAIVNAARNLARANIASGFGFWNTTAGFDISQTLIAYSSQASTFGRAFWVGLLNTLLVAGLGVIFATVLGFVIGIARLSRNWLVARMAAGYVEIIRNVPLLLQLLFWYNAVLKSLPDTRASMAVPVGGFLNNRGLFLPRPHVETGLEAALIALAVGVAAAIAIGLWGQRKRRRTGKQPHTGWIGLALIFGLPLAALWLAGSPLTFSYPQMGRFNISGGIEILPEFVALLLGLVVYTAAFIAEAVRAGILAVSPGQTEAALALGLPRTSTLRLIVVPQAMRVIVPPLTSQYLNLTKNSSLAVAIGYPDLVQVFAGSVLNITGQAVEVIAITMAVYLAISLLLSSAMALYGSTIEIVER